MTRKAPRKSSIFTSWFKGKRIRPDQTQFSNNTNSENKQLLVIGLDFGTAFTKVVVGETRLAYAVPFTDIESIDNEYLLPGIMSISENGVCALGAMEGATNIVTDMKMRLIQKNCTNEHKNEIVSFLALVLQHTRTWLMREHKKTYQNSMIDWLINVGLPTDNYHDDAMTNDYRQLVESAWTTSVASETITLDLARSVLEGEPLSQYVNSDELKQKILHPEAVGLFPEFVAQITGYVKSPMRQPDLHALMDVGAGTVDVTVFNVHEIDGEDKFPIFAKSVLPTGVYFLTKYRLNKSDYKGCWKPKAQDPPPIDSKFAKKLGLTKQELRELDKPFRKEVFDQFIDEMKYTKEKRYPGSPKWHDSEGISFFLCGGGAHVELYSNIIGEIEKSGKPYKLSVTELNKPERLKGNVSATGGYDRLSVAYGLSFDAFDIGEVVKMSDVEDVEDKDTTIKAFLCPRCEGTGGLYGNNGCSFCGGSGMT